MVFIKSPNLSYTTGTVFGGIVPKTANGIISTIFLPNDLLHLNPLQFLSTCNNYFLDILSMNKTSQGNHYQQHNNQSLNHHIHLRSKNLISIYYKLSESCTYPTRDYIHPTSKNQEEYLCSHLIVAQFQAWITPDYPLNSFGKTYRQI